MTGPEHYREAEKLLTYVADLPHGDDRATDSIAEAQAHATLALVAATALTGHGAGYLDDPEIKAWRAAAGVADG
ncbi:hypothetical protein [Nonomuraea sp. KM90]|uniref:hypothetical protein n=1 Tax=Nonomuraea sp. KM90 TaxID=3457428 RepID=UPI003FCD1E0E